MRRRALGSSGILEETELQLLRRAAGERRTDVQVTSATPGVDGAPVLVEGGVGEGFTCNLTLLIHKMGTQGCLGALLSGPSETMGAKHLFQVWVRVSAQ